MRWCDAPGGLARPRLCETCGSGGVERGVFLRMMSRPAGASATPKLIVVDEGVLRCEVQWALRELISEPKKRYGSGRVQAETGRFGVAHGVQHIHR